VANAVGRKAEVVMGTLMFFPHVRNHKMNGSAFGKNAPELRQHSAGLRRVLEHNNGNDTIKGMVRERKLLQPSKSIESGVIPGTVALPKVHTDIARMRKRRLEATLSCAGIQNACRRRRCRSDFSNKRINGGFKRIKASEQRGGDDTPGGGNKLGFKQAPRLVEPDCRRYPVQPVRGPPLGSAFQSVRESFPFLSVFQRHE